MLSTTGHFIDSTEMLVSIIKETVPDKMSIEYENGMNINFCF